MKTITFNHRQYLCADKAMKNGHFKIGLFVFSESVINPLHFF